MSRRATVVCALVLTAAWSAVGVADDCWPIDVSCGHFMGRAPVVAGARLTYMSFQGDD